MPAVVAALGEVEGEVAGRLPAAAVAVAVLNESYTTKLRICLRDGRRSVRRGTSPMLAAAPRFTSFWHRGRHYGPPEDPHKRQILANSPIRL